MRSLLLKLAVAASLALALACGGSKKDSTVAVDSVALDRASFTLVVGGASQTLTATVLPENATVRDLEWTTAGSGGVTLTGTGLSRTVAGATPGNVTVKATSVSDATKYSTCTVMVLPAGSEIAIESLSLPESLGCARGGTAQLTATLVPFNATEGLVWTSGNNAIATVTGTGATVTINGVANGSTSITVRSAADATKNASCTVTVADAIIPVQSVSLPPTLDVPTGGTAQLTATITPATATNQGLVWTSGNPAVATVTGTGLTVTINGVSGGSTAITVRSAADATKTASCTVTVSGAAASLSVSLPQTLSVPTGGTAQLTATVLPANAPNRTVTWTSSDTTKATVTGTGLTVTINGIAAGPSTIRCTSVADPTKYAECAVTVANVAVTGVSLPATMTIYVGDMANLTATLAPAGATDKVVSWSSASPAFATVPSGANTLSVTVTGVAAGTSRITVTTHDGDKTAYCDVTVNAYSGPNVWVGGEFGLYRVRQVSGAWVSTPQGGYGGSIVNKVLVDSNVVHACGYSAPNPVYWRNGVATALPRTAGTTGGEALWMCIDGATIYICGYEYTASTGTACLWTVPTAGGAATKQTVGLLPNTTWSAATGVCRMNGVTYMSGEIEAPVTGDPDYYGAAVWLNAGGTGTQTVVTYFNDGEPAYPANCIAGLNGNLIVTSFDCIASIPVANPSNVTWPSTDGAFGANVVGTTMYVAGFRWTNPYPPCYWTSTNGTSLSRTQLGFTGSSGSFGEALDIWPVGSTLYTAGRESWDDDYDDVAPRFWVGATETTVTGLTQVHSLRGANTVFAN